MKVSYDPDCDGLRILFSDAPIERSTEEVAGLILDYDNNGLLVGLEMADASERVSNPRLVEFAEERLLPQSTDRTRAFEEHEGHRAGQEDESRLFISESGG